MVLTCGRCKKTEDDQGSPSYMMTPNQVTVTVDTGETAKRVQPAQPLVKLCAECASSLMFWWLNPKVTLPPKAPTS